MLTQYLTLQTNVDLLTLLLLSQYCAELGVVTTVVVEEVGLIYAL